MSGNYFASYFICCLLISVSIHFEFEFWNLMIDALSKTILSPYLLNLYENAKLLLAELSDLQKWGTNRLLYSCWVTLLVYLISCNLTNFYTQKIKNPKQGREGTSSGALCQTNWVSSLFASLVISFPKGGNSLIAVPNICTIAEKLI